MPKNKLSNKINRVYLSGMDYGICFGQQRALDYAIIALHRLGWGKDRLKRFQDLWDDIYMDYLDEMQQEKNNGDKEFMYSHGCMERELKECCGEFYAPREARYNFGDGEK